MLTPLANQAAGQAQRLSAQLQQPASPQQTPAPAAAQTADEATEPEPAPAVFAEDVNAAWAGVGASAAPARGMTIGGL